MLLVLLLGCNPGAAGSGVYRSGANAVAEAHLSGNVRVWGPDGTVSRLASPGPGGTTFLGQSGPLWRVEREVPAPPKAAIVAAAVVERAGWRMRDLLEGTAGGIDPVRGSGVYVRSVVKVRRENAPPVYVVAATRDDVGAGRFQGPEDVRSGKNCDAGVATMDDKGERLLTAIRLGTATRLCVVPMALAPVDLDGDGGQDVLVYGQNGTKGFRSWFSLQPDGSLVTGVEEAWEAIP